MMVKPKGKRVVYHYLAGPCSSWNWGPICGSELGFDSDMGLEREKITCKRCLKALERIEWK